MLIPGNLPVERMPRNVPSNMQGHLHGLCACGEGGWRGGGEGGLSSRKKLVFMESAKLSS